MLYYEIEPGLRLMLWDERDAETIFNTVDENREFLDPFLPWVAATRSAQDSLEFVRNARQRFANSTSLACGIWLDQRLAGAVELFTVRNQHSTGELGYWLAEWATGRGIMTRSCRALIDFGFNKRGYNRIVIRFVPENVASRRIAERLGFTQEGVARQAYKMHDGLHDLVTYSLLRSEW